MENEEKRLEEVTTVGEMHKQRQTMPDGKRYIIFYTFGTEEEAKPEEDEVKENV